MQNTTIVFSIEIIIGNATTHKLTLNVFSNMTNSDSTGKVCFLVSDVNTLKINKNTSVYI